MTAQLTSVQLTFQNEVLYSTISPCSDAQFSGARLQKGKLKFNNGTFRVNWKLAADKKSITFKVMAESAGWIGLGFSQSGDMRDADIVAGEVTSNTTLTVKVYNNNGKTF